MVYPIVTILLTALLSSIFTLLLALLVFHRYLKRRLESEIDRLTRQWGETIQERVQRGVLEGVKSIPSTETAVGLVRSGLDTLLGGADSRQR